MALIEIDGLPINSMVIFHGKPLVITRGYCWYTIIYIYICIYIYTMIFSDILQHFFSWWIADGPSGSISGAAIQLRRPDLALKMIDHEDFMKIQKDAWRKLHFKGETDEIWNAWCNRSTVSRFKIIQASCIVFLILGGPFFVRNFLSNVGFGPEKVARMTCWVPSCCHPVTVIHSDTGLARRCACEESENHEGTGPMETMLIWACGTVYSRLGPLQIPWRKISLPMWRLEPSTACGATQQWHQWIQWTYSPKNCFQEVKAFD